MKIRRALVSVHDKTGIVDFVRALTGLGVEIVSTGGTAKLLRESGLPVIEVSEVTGFPEMLDGRVKTLHPKIHGGILARRDVPEHLAALAKHGIAPIDLVVSGLYPFEQTVARPGVTRPEAIEQIDVGGPAMIRAAAKNHGSVAVVTAPSQYRAILDELRGDGGLGDATRARLAQEAFRRTAEYDAAIAAYLGSADSAPDPWPAGLRLENERVLSLRYGENSHQTAAFYRQVDAPTIGLGGMKQLHGPELGYNNLLDFSAALSLLLEFAEPAAVVIKHTNPCGAAVGDTVGAAMVRAKASDPVSIYGGIVGVNRTLDRAVVEALAGIFVEILFAPAYTADALDVLGGLLAQSADQADLDPAELRTVTKRAPTPAELAALRFAWRVAKHTKSNAIVLSTREQVIGVGAGQMNRVDSARLAVMRAREVGLGTAGTVCASDAFFPFRDGLDVVALAGATAVIQPGGSLRDDEIIAAADERGVAMAFTGIRHFRH